MTKHVHFPCDDDPDDESAVRLHILGHMDYWVAVAPGTRWPYGDAVRLRTSGERDANVTFLIAALFKYGRGESESAAECAKIFAANVMEQRDSEPRADPSIAELLGLDAPWSAPAILQRLCHAADHLLNDCDAHGHEEIRAARDAARSLLQKWPKAFDHSDQDAKFEVGDPVWVRVRCGLRLGISEHEIVCNEMPDVIVEFCPTPDRYLYRCKQLGLVDEADLNLRVVAPTQEDDHGV